MRGDLDWVVMKCLEKDRTRRYDSAAELRADIQRFLANEPVMARPPSKLYRFQKLVRRNRLAFAAGSAILASLIIALLLRRGLWSRKRRNGTWRKRPAKPRTTPAKLPKKPWPRPKPPASNRTLTCNIPRLPGSNPNLDRAKALAAEKKAADAVKEAEAARRQAQAALEQAREDRDRAALAQKEAGEAQAQAQTARQQAEAAEAPRPFRSRQT